MITFYLLLQYRPILRICFVRKCRSFNVTEGDDNSTSPSFRSLHGAAGPGPRAPCASLPPRGAGTGRLAAREAKVLSHHERIQVSRLSSFIPISPFVLKMYLVLTGLWENLVNGRKRLVLFYVVEFRGRFSPVRPLQSSKRTNFCS